MNYNTDIAIIGAGPVGLFAIFQAGMLKMRCCVIDALDNLGGQCTALYPEKPIYDIPAYTVITAKSLIENLVKQAEPFKPLYFLGQTAEKITTQNNLFSITTNKNVTVNCKAIIIAAGCGAFGPNRPPIENILDYENKSVFYQVNKISDFDNKNVVIAGGGDSAADWAVELSSIVKKLYIVHRRKNFRCLPKTANKLEQLSSVGQLQLIVPYQLSRLNGNNGLLSSVVVKNISTQEEKELKADILLPFFGISSNLGNILNWGLEIKNHHILVDSKNFQTNCSRIYAVGDIASYPGKLKLILSGFSEVATACHDIYNIIYPDLPLNFQYSTTKGITNLETI